MNTYNSARQVQDDQVRYMYDKKLKNNDTAMIIILFLPQASSAESVTTAGNLWKPVWASPSLVPVHAVRLGRKVHSVLYPLHASSEKGLGVGLGCHKGIEILLLGSFGPVKRSTRLVPPPPPPLPLRHPLSRPSRLQVHSCGRRP